MGWVSTEITCRKPNGQVDFKEEVRKIIDFKDGNREFKALKIIFHGDTAYVAVQEFINNIATRVFATTVFVQPCIDENFTSVKLHYKIVDETMGPTGIACPISILKILTPTDNEIANNWRWECWNDYDDKKAKERDPNALKNLPIGAKVSFMWPYGSKEETIIAQKRPYKKRSAWISGSYRYRENDIEQLGYTVIK